MTEFLYKKNLLLNKDRLCLKFRTPSARRCVKSTIYVSIATLQSSTTQSINLGFSYIKYYFKYFFLSKIKNIERREKMNKSGEFC